MVTTLLLVVIYLAFISLGLPDTILGVTIKSLQQDFGINLATGGFISMIITGGTVLSSFFSDKIIKKVGTGKLVFISCLMTGLSLFGFSISPSFLWLIPFALPLGLGGGTVDSALNNYVALHFKAHHMNWLHSFWGLGATLGPIIMSLNLLDGNWRGGYKTISLIQLLFSVVLLLSIPLWKKHREIIKIKVDSSQETKGTTISKQKGIILTLIIMFLYCCIEIGTGLWASSFLIKVKNLPIHSAARFVALYYIGITVGRFIAGIISFKLGNRELIRIGIVLTIVGVISLILPIPKYLTGIGFIIIGLGLAPIFPAMIHETPIRFGREQSQSIIGKQMAFAYLGSALGPPSLGILYQYIGIQILPICILILLSSLLIITEMINKK